LIIALQLKKAEAVGRRVIGKWVRAQTAEA
jgi:hypothetical protein